MSSDTAPSHAGLSTTEGIHGVVAGAIASEADMIAGTITGDPTGTRSVDAQDVSSAKLFLRSDISAIVRFTNHSPVRWTGVGYPLISMAVAVGATTPVGAGPGARIWSTTTGCELVWDGTQWILPIEIGAYTATNASDVVNSTTTGSDVMTFAVKSGVSYVFDAYLICRAAAATTGIQVAANGPATSALAYWADTFTSTTGRVLANASAWETYVVGTTGPASSTTDTLVVLRGAFRPSADGTFAIRIKSEVAASAVTARIGSVLTIRAAQPGGYIAANPAIPVSTFAGTSYTLTAADQGEHIKCTSSSPVTITVPATLPEGFHVRVSQRGSGAVSFVHASDTTRIRKRSTLQRTTAGVDATATLLTDGPDEHLLEGDLLPV